VAFARDLPKEYSTPRCRHAGTQCQGCPKSIGVPHPRIVGQEIDGWWSISLDLRLVENAVPPRKHASAATPLLLGIAIIGILAAIVDLPEDNRGGLLALANLGSQRLPLTIAGPASGTVACSLRRDPQAENVGSPVSLAGTGVDGARGR
jgi:hypothetical protein